MANVFRAYVRRVKLFNLTARALPLLLLLACLAQAGFAGPPFQTDDPQTVSFGHYEFYIFGGSDGTPIETDPFGPQFEFNWGALPNTQIHVVAGWGAILPANNPAYLPAGAGPGAYGLLDTEVGVKYRFFRETARRPMMGIFPMVELPTGSYARGLGVGHAWYKLPVWIQKDWGRKDHQWTSYGGAGFEIVPQTQYKNFAYAGWLLQRDLGSKWTLGGELFTHGPEGLASAQTRSALMADFGGYYYFRNPGFQLLFALGHTVAGQSETYGYLGLYWTWGHKPHRALRFLSTPPRTP